MRLIFEVLNKGAVPRARRQSFLISGEKGKDSMGERYATSRDVSECQEMSLMLPALLPKTHLGLCCLSKLLCSYLVGLFRQHTPMVCSCYQAFSCLIFATLHHTTGIWHLLFPLSRRRFPLLLSKERHPHSLNINLPPIFSSRFSHRSSFPFIYSHCHLSFVSLATSCLLVQLRDQSLHLPSDVSCEWNGFVCLR